MSLTVTTTSGTFIGTHSRGTRRWAGIPYAKPPVGDLRFQAPQPATPARTITTPKTTATSPAVAPTEPTPANRFSTPVPQFDPDGTGPKRNPNDTNWLTVNVWAPLDPPDHPLPVMVWIHGGAYVLGSAADPMYMGAPFAAQGTIFVSVNYRLGIEGFMLFPDAPANRGLLDQALALQWVRDNAQAFGGDPGNVTVFGESAGAGSIFCHLTMPSSRGLFDRAILQSPPAMVLERPLAEDITAQFAALASSSPSSTEVAPTAASFSHLSPEDSEELMRTFAKTQLRFAPRWGKAVAFTPPLTPVVDGEVLPANPWSTDLLTGVDIMVGCNRDEFAVFVDPNDTITRAKAIERVALVGPGSTVMEAARLAGSGGSGKSGRSGRSGGSTKSGGDRDLGAANARARELNAHYLDILGEASPLDIFIRVQSDYMFTLPTLLTATAAERRGSPAHVYFFAADPVGGLGSPHIAELPPLFDAFRTSYGQILYPHVAEVDRALGARMRQAWVQFATTGEPGWGTWTAAEPTTRVFGYEDYTAPHPLMERFAAFEAAPSRPLPVFPLH